jgi:hypothetical protein
MRHHRPNVGVSGFSPPRETPLQLRAHAGGNASWLRQLESNATAGQPLPPQLLVPRPGRAGGPAATPLLLYYRRDWWRALLAAGRASSGDGASGGGGGLSEADEEQEALPPTWLLLADLVSELLNKDLDGDGRPDHVLCVDLTPGGWVGAGDGWRAATRFPSCAA